MPSWLAVLLVIVGVLALGMLRERWRIAGMEKIARFRGLHVISPFRPDGRQPFDTLAARFSVRFSRRWGVGVEGEVDDVQLTIAEHEVPRTGSGNPDRWFTLVAWPSPRTAGPVLIWLGQGLSTMSDAGVAERLGVPQVDPATLRFRTTAGLLIEAEAGVREAWLTAERTRALEAWPHGGALLRDSGYCAWRVPGLLTPAQLETVLGQVPLLRRLLE
jgi:hypothetical protein